MKTYANPTDFDPSSPRLDPSSDLRASNVASGSITFVCFTSFFGDPLLTDSLFWYPLHSSKFR